MPKETTPHGHGQPKAPPTGSSSSGVNKSTHKTGHTVEMRNLSLKEKMEGMASLLKDQNYTASNDASRISQLNDYINEILFPGLPPHYPLRKKLVISRSSTSVGAAWDMLQISLAIVTCGTYVVSTLPMSLQLTRGIHIMDIVMAQFFLAEFLLNFYVANSWMYFLEFVTIIDLLSIFPVYFGFVVPSFSDTSLQFLQCLRILRLTHIFKSFKLMRNYSGVKRQVIYLTVVLVSIIFLAAGFTAIIENEFTVRSCLYINAATDWKPSCSATAPADSILDCTCSEDNCRGAYIYSDTDGAPSSIVCENMTFFNAFYFIIVTVSSVGYGDIKPTNVPSKAFVILFVAACLVIIPMSVGKLQFLLSLKSPFRRAFVSQPDEKHVVVCGHVNDANKLSRFFSEFYHEDRVTEEEFHAVILSPQEPSEDVRVLLSGPMLVSRVTYVIGSAMATEDLKRVKAESARCMFFLCNTSVQGGSDTNEDAATILRALSVSNYNPELECLVQVLRPEERVILKDSDVDCILCLDEFKTVLQARNSICPGFSTFVENIFHSVEGVSEDSPLFRNMLPWYKEYLHGAGMELYFVELDFNFVRNCRYSFSLVAEMIYFEFEVLSLGVCNNARDSIVFNPRVKDLAHFSSMKDFFLAYGVLLVLADDQQQAELVAKGIADPDRMRQANQRLMAEEDLWPCHSGPNGVESLSSDHGQDNGKTRIRGEKDTADSDEDEESASKTYIGFATYQHNDDTADRAQSPTILSKKFGALTMPNAIKGPALTKLPTIQKGVKARKIRMLPDIKLVKQHAQISARQMLGDMTHVIGGLGQVSIILDDASTLRNHIVVFGNDAYLMMFISELRRPAVVGENYHPIVIMMDHEPKDWDHVSAQFNDVYCVRTAVTRQTLSQKANLDTAFSLIFLASRDSFEDDDAVTLFSFLKLEQIIPAHVFCSIELNSTSNMSVLNSTIMKKERRLDLEKRVQSLRTKKRLHDDARNIKLEHGSSSIGTQGRRKSALSVRGSFSSKGSSASGAAATASEALLANLQEGNLSSSVKTATDLRTEEKNLAEESGLAYQKEKHLWEAIDTHYIFPVYACARVFVASSFETLLVQSFYVKLTPVICERFVCGQLSQTCQQVSMPSQLVGRRFIDLFRLFASCGATVLALYRAPRREDGSLLPFVFTSPPADTILYENDKAFVFASPRAVNASLAKCSVIKGKSSSSSERIFGI